MKRALLLAFVFGLSLPAWALPLANKGNFGMAGWLVYWDAGNQSLKDFEAHARDIDRVYCEWYNVEKDGLPHFLKDVSPTAVEETLRAARANGVKVFMMGGNYDNQINDHDSKRVEKFLFNPALEKEHIQDLIRMAKQRHSDGIDIDYENLKKGDRDAFSRFMMDLSGQCKANGLLLGCAVAPKTDPDGTWDGNQCFDYAAIGKAVDVMHIMTYDDHWGTSAAGPVAPPDWTEQVAEFAAYAVGGLKVELGLAGYGYDWVDTTGVNIGWDDLLGILKKYHIDSRRDPQTQEITFTYPGRHTVWFCDAGSYIPKFETLKKNKLAGFAMWRLGTEDPRFWPMLEKEKYARQ